MTKVVERRIAENGVAMMVAAKEPEMGSLMLVLLPNGDERMTMGTRRRWYLINISRSVSFAKNGWMNFLGKNLDILMRSFAHCWLLGFGIASIFDCRGYLATTTL
jgi:hypothetical protein